ncbi:MAG: PaaI family thioesterase [Anaerolineales bacterium]|nr:PaaI family thioesterase [Anaerolineales bacterium]
MQKQPNSDHCFVCGRKNPIGLQMHFYSGDDGCVYADYTPRDEHQSYPGVMHGGLITAMLDEIIGRTAIAHNLWCMTAQLTVRFKKPVPIGAALKLKGEIAKKTGRLLEGRGEIRLPDGTLAVEATGTYIKIPDEQIAQFQDAMGGWRVDE